MADYCEVGFHPRQHSVGGSVAAIALELSYLCPVGHAAARDEYRDRFMTRRGARPLLDVEPERPDCRIIERPSNSA